MSFIILIVFGYLFLQMSGMWLVYCVTQNPSVVDVSWSLGLMMSGLFYLGWPFVTVKAFIIGTLLIIWALRLAAYLWYTRIKIKHIDKRYTQLSQHWKVSQSLGFFLNFHLQGFLIGLISMMFYWARNAFGALTLIDYIAIFLCLSGIIGESIADWQLTQFKKRVKKGVCNEGLWYYSRHPNYFFDWVTWLGFTIFCMQFPKGYLSIASLMVLYGIFTKLTGPLTEQSSLISRGDLYKAYQKKTAFFFPWFKNK